MAKKKAKPIRHDWVKLQKEFDLYKLKNREKTLKDFCELKGLNYLQTRKQIKTNKTRTKVEQFDKAKDAAYTETMIKKKSLKERKKHSPIMTSLRFTIGF